MTYRKATKQKRRFDRLSVLTVTFFLFAGALAARLFKLQILNYSFYTALAEGRGLLSEKLTPIRGEIYFRDASAPKDLLPVAINRTMRQVYAIPEHVEDPEATAEKLVEVLPLDKEEVRKRLARPKDKYEPILHDVEPALADKVDLLRLKGIFTAPERARFYPFADITSHLTGFIGYSGDDRVGQYGLEGYWEKTLAGEAGSIGAAGDDVREARNGDTLVLTIDRTIQHTVCKKLEAAVEKHGADSGTVIIVQPDTGAILAMCTAPGFDANHYADADIVHYANAAISSQYEPGSVVKTLTLSAGLDKKLITPDTTYEDKGSVRIGKYTIRNAENKTYGVQTMAKVLEESINTGAMYVAGLLGTNSFREYMEHFGLGEETGIELQGESKGDIDSLHEKGDIYSATASFGQGISMTPLQLVLAYAAIANEGVLMKPYLVDEIRKANGFNEQTKPKEERQLISADAARTMKAMLVNVVRKGHGKRAAVKGYYVGGKTGTAQIPLPDRPGYDPSRHIGTFVGMAPITKPAFVMLTKIDVPRDVQFAESSAAPLFGDIAAFLLHYYRIPPDDVGNDS